jgi:hypothetical protein
MGGGRTDVFGGIQHERIHLNEDTIWNGQNGIGTDLRISIASSLPAPPSYCPNLPLLGVPPVTTHRNYGPCCLLFPWLDQIPDN